MTETVPYDVTRTIGEIEVRRYPEIVLASVVEAGDESGFSLLFRYITGNNQVRGKVPMTSPVITSRTIPMTSPVVSDKGSISFVLPTGMQRGDVPDPLDDRIRITTLPPRDVAVVRFSGYAGEEDVQNATSRLLGGLEEARISTHGQVFLMRYNPPWTPGFLRRNEVAIEVRV